MAPSSTPSLTADSLCRMPEKDGRRFYALLDVLMAMALPKLERALGPNAPPLPLVPGGVGAQNAQMRNIITSFILQHIEDLVQEMDSGQHDRLIRRTLGRRLTESDREQIRSWRLHIQDDFFVLKHIPKQGSIFCQVGIASAERMSPTVGAEQDLHPPRVFVVKGLATPLAELTDILARDFAKSHPSVANKYPDLNMALVHTIILPYMGGITYMASMAPPTAFIYKTPQDILEAGQIAVKAVQKALHGNDKLYRSLNPETDAHVRRLAMNPLNQNWFSMSLHNVTQEAVQEQQEHCDDDENSTKTSVQINQVFWHPYADRNHPSYDKDMQQAATGPRPFLLEGLKSAITQVKDIHDNEPCPFHCQYGRSCPTFKDCCKTKHLKNLDKSKRSIVAGRAIYQYDPLEQDESERIMNGIMSAAGRVAFNPLPHVRISPLDIQVIKICIPLWAVPSIKERLDSTDIFHAVLEYKWAYTGYLSLVMKPYGMMVFGEVELNPRTGQIQAEGMSARRVNNLIRALRRVCEGFPIESASLEAQPMHKLKPDPVALEQNRALLQQGLTEDVQVSVDKQANKSMNRRCAYCGGSQQQENLSRCAGCRSVYYCSREHQKLHWPDHKVECKKRAAEQK